MENHSAYQKQHEPDFVIFDLKNHEKGAVILILIKRFRFIKISITAHSCSIEQVFRAFPKVLKTAQRGEKTFSTR